MMWWLTAWIVWNVSVAALYGWDKYKARHRRWRIPNRLLLWCSVIGGGCGGFLAMLVFRHKTRQWPYYVANVVRLLLSYWGMTQSMM